MVFCIRYMNDDGENSAAASVGDASLKHTEIDDYAGGSSRLGKASIGSSSTTAALMLHPCVYVSGAGEASEDILQQIFGQVGPCTVTLVEPDSDEEGEEASGKLTGEASVLYGEGAHAISAIQRFDGSPFNDDKLTVSVSRSAAQGSLTKRGGRRGSEKLTHHDRQQMMFSQARQHREESEKGAFAAAREAVFTARSRPTGPRPTVLSEQSEGLGLGGGGARGRAADANIAKRQKAATGLPRCCLVAKSTSATSAAPPAAPPAAPAAPAGGGALLGLGDYGSSDDASDGGAE